jgi:hypothetical protein
VNWFKAFAAANVCAVRPAPPMDAEFDIEGLLVISVEREKEYEEDQVTTICLRDSVGEAFTYYLRCSREKHDELVARFRRKIGTYVTTEEQP